MRQIVIHYHIFKNAGSTIDSIFKRNFRDGFSAIDGSTAGGTLDSSFFLKHLIEHPKVKVVSSHQGRPPVPTSPTINFHPIIFLRHPIDRIGSVYLFERNQPKNDPPFHVKVAQENDIEGYVKWRLADNNGSVIRNFQTIYLSGREKDMKTAKATRADLMIALERINNLDFFGIVESFQESITRMKRYLFDDFGKINTSYNIQNKSHDRKNMLSERVEELKNSLSQSLYNEMLEKNAFDMELYDNSLKIFLEKAK